jgi:hypothetical protein
LLRLQRELNDRPFTTYLPSSVVANLGSIWQLRITIGELNVIIVRGDVDWALLLASSGLRLLNISVVRAQAPRDVEMNRTPSAVCHCQLDFERRNLDVIREPNIQRSLRNAMGIERFLIAGLSGTAPAWRLNLRMYEIQRE